MKTTRQPALNSPAPPLPLPPRRPCPRFLGVGSCCPLFSILGRSSAAVVLCLCAAFSLQAQPRTGGGQTGGGGGGGGGGFGGGGIGNVGGGNTGGRTGASATSRTYPANGTIPVAYFSMDPETRRVVVIAPNEAMPYVMQ